MIRATAGAQLAAARPRRSRRHPAPRRAPRAGLDALSGPGGSANRHRALLASESRSGRRRRRPVTCRCVCKYPLPPVPAEEVGLVRRVDVKGRVAPSAVMMSVTLTLIPRTVAGPTPLPRSSKRWAGRESHSMQIPTHDPAATVRLGERRCVVIEVFVRGLRRVVGESEH